VRYCDCDLGDVQEQRRSAGFSANASRLGDDCTGRSGCAIGITRHVAARDSVRRWAVRSRYDLGTAGRYDLDTAGRYDLGTAGRYDLDAAGRRECDTAARDAAAARSARKRGAACSPGFADSAGGNASR
jgi:hypothetical protein